MRQESVVDHAHETDAYQTNPHHSRVLVSSVLCEDACRGQPQLRFARAPLRTGAVSRKRQPATALCAAIPLVVGSLPAEGHRLTLAEEAIAAARGRMRLVQGQFSRGR